MLEGRQEDNAWNYFTSAPTDLGPASVSGADGRFRWQLKLNLGVPDANPDPTAGYYPGAVDWFRFDAFDVDGRSVWNFTGHPDTNSVRLGSEYLGTYDVWDEWFDIQTQIGDFSVRFRYSIEEIGSGPFFFDDSLNAWVGALPGLPGSPGSHEIQHTFSDPSGFSYSSYRGDLTYGSVSVAAVPEPETYAMFLAGLGLIGAVARRR
ncbi:MAG: PEP-CTERM sorting domain-containing protein [Rhodocyclaceae bacterium]|nr:PEP-CTERM sorting domain-containing protein [Rhodocyclaceae bacterium]